MLPDHFHLLIRIREEAELGKQNIHNSAALSRKFGNWFNAYAKAFNKKYQRVSSLFEHRFERTLIKNEAHFDWIVYYLHWNPQKHGYAKDFRKWPFSSYQSILSNKSSALAREEVLEWFGGRAAFVAAHENALDFESRGWELPD